MAQTEELHTRPTISLIVPVHDGGAPFDRCLASLSALDPPPLELIVVSDGGTEESCLMAAKHGARLVRLPQSGGPARARNRGADEASGDVLFFVDADVIVAADALDRIASHFQDSPDLAAIIGSYDDQPDGNGFVAQYKNLFHHYTHQSSQQEASTFWGACGAIRRDVFLEVGGFDESYTRPCVEDIELGYRLRSAGHRILLDKDLQVKHLKVWTLRTMLKADFFDRALPWTALILRNGRFPNDLNLRYSARLSVFLTFGSILSLIGAVWWLALLWVALAQLLLLVLINLEVCLFFVRKRGVVFAVRSFPLHGLYFLFSGVAFGIGVGRHWMRRHKEGGDA